MDANNMQQQQNDKLDASNQVNKNKSWNEVAKALNIKDDKSAVSFLRKQYIKYLFAFECKFDHSLDFLSDHGPEPLRLNHEMRRGPDMDKQPAPKRQATTNGPTSVQPERYAPPNTYYNSYYPPSSHPGPHPGGPHPAPDIHNGGPPPNMTSGFHGPPPTGPPPPSDHPGYRPPMYYPGQYPPGHPGHHPSHMGYMRPPYQPDHMSPHGPDSWRFRQPYPGNQPPPGPTIYGEQTIHRYPANAVQPPYQPSPAPRLQVAPAPTKMSNLGRSNERAKNQSDSSKKKSSSSAPAPPTAALQVSSQPIHISPTVTTPSISSMPTSASSHLAPVRMHPSERPAPPSGPPTIEQATPNISKRRKLTSKELGYVETIRLVMSLKSGLLTESTWVVNVLNILLCDNTMVAYFYLGHHPNLLRMLDRLLDHFQKVLVDIFGEKVVGSKLYSDAKLVGLQPSTKKYKDVAPVTLVIDPAIKESADPYPTIEHNCLKSLDYIDTMHEINSKLKLTPSYPVNLSELDQKFGDSKPLEVGADKENEPVLKMEPDLPSIPSEELKEELSKIKDPIIPQMNGVNGVKPETVAVVTDGKKEDPKVAAKAIDYENISEESLRALWKRLRSSNEKRVENESVKIEDEFLFIQSDQDRHLSSRCSSVMNIFRSLSFIPGNDMILSHHPGFLLMISQLLSLHHVHYSELESQDCNQSFERTSKRSIKEKEALGLPSGWCFSKTLDSLRESSFCIMANISGQLDFSNFNQSLYTPLIQSVVHWVTCSSSEAVDPFPPAYLSTITPQRLMLEALSKMSILSSNLQPIVRSIKDQIPALFKALVLLLGDRTQQVAREFALVIMSNLSQTGGNEGVEVAHQLANFTQVISLLLKFLEDAEASAANFALNAHMAGHSSLPSNISQEELCGGTSIDMLRRAALTLIHLAKYSDNKKLFLTHQHRVLNLAMSRFTHPRIGAMIANLLYHMESDWKLT
ncbi:AT-rich interactive domain-containing protein 1B-like [Bolinopsis microptera]|uniref:AT-rich interactive domain-containing protein 1B-like n=1 Tax=Bolinopsis microptera TaxID=2820187 RepID=UPI00307A6185